MFDFSIVTQWFDDLLRETLGLGDFLSILIECVLVGVAVLGGYALLAIVLIFMERKVCAFYPMLRGQKIADLIATCAAIDVVIPDIDR